MIYKEILEKINSSLEPLELESYPFLVKWYNSRVGEKFKLDYDDNTLACLVINRPKMFEKLFLQYIFEKFKKDPGSLESQNDLIDECLNQSFNKIKKELENWFAMDVDVIKDYEMMPGSRRPKIIMQTCAHVSGAAYFYDPKNFDYDLVNDAEKSYKKNLMGVCLHPRYGGWFAMRAVFVFRDVVLEDGEIDMKNVVDPLNGDMTKVLDVLQKFNFNWKDSRYRDSCLKSTI
ncbi:methylmalonic aciduria and homocystinuria type C -like protein [Brachionus plicatilis]|uniref:Cyanocobalamin reductase (cyanide-eliminating) n=1 Tax=Brachionus plicatilis TaxID=10195 RepID=A0A3M7T382_BRAPC|nr:methylmalonic aciduria and homocystinuria type C -like protein [Brachionus plicatilis]